MKDPKETLSLLKYRGSKQGMDALNLIATQPENVKSNHRNACLECFVEQRITSVLLVDIGKLKEIEMLRRIGSEGAEGIPHDRFHEDFLDVLIAAKQKAATEKIKRTNFFGYERQQLFLMADAESMKPVEQIMEQMGLRIIHFKGALNKQAQHGTGD